ncbi:hypothetical protein CWB76_19765, partial [Pseudoalteromonas sp. S1609]
TVDLNTIPVSMIKQLEVIKDGSSPVYGTDSIASVGNIIFKDNFEGLARHVNSAFRGDGDGSENNRVFTLGSSFDK